LLLPVFLLLLPPRSPNPLGAANPPNSDFAPFDVDVTTADPGDAALAGVGQKAVIGGASGDWYGVAGGIAYVNSFGRPGLPCFIFAKGLGPNNPKFIWEATSHELGHTLGLLHDGVLPNPAMPNGTAYYSGQGYWAPLMVSSSRGLVRLCPDALHVQ
jgi:hypothetical protein